MKLGFSGQALGHVMSFGEICRIARKYGMTACEIWEVNAGNNIGYADKDVSKIKKIAEDEGVQIDCVTLGEAFNVNDDTVPERYAANLCSAIEAAKFLGAGRVNHYCAGISPSEADFKRMEKYWSEPIYLAEKLGIILALENEAHDATKTPDRMIKIIEHFNSPFFKTNLDVTNYYQAGCDGFPDAYDLLRSHIGYIHIKNARRNLDGFRYVPIPRGAVNIGGLLTQVIEEGVYDGLCSLEPHTAPEKVEEYYAIETEWLKNYFK